MKLEQPDSSYNDLLLFTIFKITTSAARTLSRPTKKLTDILSYITWGSRILGEIAL